MPEVQSTADLSDLVRRVDAATEVEIARAAWAWRNDKDRETDGSDDAYFRNYWRSLPGLRAYVQAQIDFGWPMASALPTALTTERADG